MWFSVVWALANCSNFALHPTLTGLESTVSRHPLLLLHQFIPMFISYKQSMRQAAETSEAAFASIAFCAWLSARVTWASKVLSFIGNNGWESALTLRFWMGLGPFLAYLSMLANNEWPSLPILARIQLSTAGLEFVQGRGRNKRVLSYLESKKATTKWLRHHTSLWLNGVNCSFGSWSFEFTKGTHSTHSTRWSFRTLHWILGASNRILLCLQSICGIWPVQWTALDITVFLISPLLSQTASDDIRTLSVLIWASSICWSFWLNSSNFLSET